MNEVYIRKMKEDEMWFLKMSILFGLLFTFCIYRNLSGLLFAVTRPGADPVCSKVPGQSGGAGENGFRVVFCGNRPSGSVHLSYGKRIFPLFQHPGNPPSVHGCDGASVL